VVWERSFVAVTVLLGATPGDAWSALPDGARQRTGDLADNLDAPRRATRAQGLAAVVQEIAVDLGAVTLR
jgi:hypothetical protein